MKCMIPEIAWHNREPILCADIQPTENECYKLATGGSDSHLLLWQASILGSGAVAVEMIADLTRHQRAVNAVRWSPNGQYLASADDDANIIVWNLKTDNIPLLEGETNDKETWVVTKILRGHKEDIYDLCWSPNGMKLLTGSIDNTAIIWDFTKGKIETILSDHKAFVQGVAWDPKGQFVATLCSDRLCRVFDSTTKQTKARIGKGFLPVPESHPFHRKEVKYFHDDTFKSYFRRVQFSPDGNLLITPCGNVETDDCNKALNATFLFTLDSLSQPAAVLPLSKECSIAVRCCPILFELRPDGPDPFIDLPYRMIIAVATDNGVILYDTQQLAPFAHFQKIHYTRLTDLTWSMDARLLLACSTDGYCTFITFETNELGCQYAKEESEHEESVFDMSGVEELGMEDVTDDKSKKSNFLIKWANQSHAQDKIIASDDDDCARKKMKLDPHHTGENEKEGKMKTADFIDLTSPVKMDKNVKIKKITPKRIIPITIVEKKEHQAASVSPAARKPRRSEANNHKDKMKPPKTLLNFLSNKTPEKSKALGNVASTVNVLDESEARDAWKCEDSTQTTTKVTHTQQQNMHTNASNDLTETIPDFKLQLEESSTMASSCDSKMNVSNKTEELSTSQGSSKTQTESEMLRVKENTVQLNTDTNTKTMEKENSIDDGKSNLAGESEIELKNNVVSACVSKKTGRRIPLITLSSPKTKKQKQDT